MSESKKRRVKVFRRVQEPQAAMQLLTGVRVVCREDPRIEALSHVTDLIDGFVDYSVHWTLPNAVKAKYPHLVQRLLGRMDTINEEDKRLQFERAIAYAAATGSLPLMQQLLENMPVKLKYEVVVAAALNGDLALLKWLKANVPSLFARPNSWAEQVAFDAASERGCLETVQWLVETFPDAVWSLGPAALGGHLDVVKWLHQHATLDGVQLNFPVGVMDRLIFAVSSTHVKECSDKKNGAPLEAVTWRFFETRAPRSTDAMDWAARKGNLEMLQWLHVNRSERCSSDAVLSAAEAGHMEVLLFLHERYSHLWLPRAMDCAARGGQLDVVKWINANRGEGCTASAMDWAAENGHLEVVKWLHENRSEGCTPAAMDCAAKNGHLDVVLWLQDNRREGCTTRAMDLAAENGHLDVVRWLHENRTEGCTTDAVDRAAGYGHLEVIRFLYANRTEGGTARAIDWAEQGEMHEVLRLFEEQNIDLPIPGWGD